LNSLCKCDGDWHEHDSVGCGSTIVVFPCEFVGRHSPHNYSTKSGSGIDARCPGARPSVYVAKNVKSL
jgi:hypothetical protein